MFVIEAQDGSILKATEWKGFKKWSNVLTISALTFISPFGSSMFAPSTRDAMRDFGSKNESLETFSVSIFVLGYAFGPLIHAPMSEMYGRLPLYHINSFLFILANVACALSVSLPMLIVFRLVAGFVGSCPLAIGPGSVADMFQQDERGRAIAVWNLPVLLGPAIGPLVGSYLATATNWRWNFWFLSIAMAAFLVFSVAILRESHEPTLLRRRLRLAATSNEIDLSNDSEATPVTTKSKMLNAISRPCRMLVYSPIVLVVSLCTAVNYGFIYIIFTTMSQTFMDKYGISNNDVGLTYLSFGLGNIIGNVAIGFFSDKLLKALAGRSGRTKPEHRLPPLVPGSIIVPIGLFIYGWTLYFNVHFMVPLLGLFIVGFGTILIFIPVSTYLVDAYVEAAASANAANTVLRSIGGGLLPLCGAGLYERVGDGWGNSVLAFVGLAFIPAIWMLCLYGERLRLRFPVKL
ncbi:hypothetical protein ACHAPJ_013016 [Fusarium lateritium]